MKKFVNVALSAVLAATGVAGFASCSDKEEYDFTVGLICLHDSNSTYDKNFIDSMNRAIEELGLEKGQLVLKTGVPEDNTCYDTAMELVDDGCDVIFADSFGHEDSMVKAAKEAPDVQFAHATGTKAHTEKLDNFSNAFASIYEGRYLAGVAAGMKLKEMEEAGELKTENYSGENIKIGYVGAWSYAEVISGYTSFYLGVKSVVENVVMDVQFTSSWYDEAKEREAATALIESGCALISQHADSWGAPMACEEKGVPNVSYNGNTSSRCPETAIISSAVNWTPYFKYMIQCAMNDEKIDTDWCGGLGTEVYDGTKDLLDGSVVISALGQNAAEGTAAKLEEVRQQLRAGTLKVFDTSKFTVGGETLTSYMADVDADEKYTPDTEVIENGVFMESKFRSAPYFDVKIDGINWVNQP